MTSKDSTLEELEAELREATQKLAAEKSRVKTPEEIKVERAIRKTLRNNPFT